MLYIVATPIGHLEDLTARALKALQDCDAILCEDTRRTTLLLQKYQIKKPLISYHQFKEKQSLKKILRRLEEGDNLALVSDAGTPCINDPGQLLVQECIQAHFPFTVLPGPCSLIQALVMSGFATAQFQFIGFLPKKPKPALQRALFYPGTTVCFESPQRLLHTLQVLDTLDPERHIAVAREMTKMFEECRRDTPKNLAAHFEKTPPKGEVVLVIAEGKIPPVDDLEELIATLQTTHGLSLKAAIKMAAQLTHTKKNVVYKEIHGKKE
ncbi:MAG: 16S rRNA (cytidine(1402)-2'-O)-methyltransferase [Chlamydiia bacterium]|nr:16S rRNA (cytidine(1402)-2'-O)-methyltransferase [Chlamydiia bacterium]